MGIPAHRTHGLLDLLQALAGAQLSTQLSAGLVRKVSAIRPAICLPEQVRLQANLRHGRRDGVDRPLTAAACEDGRRDGVDGLLTAAACIRMTMQSAEYSCRISTGWTHHIIWQLDVLFRL